MMAEQSGFWSFAKTPAGAAVVASAGTLLLASLFFLLWAGVLKPGDLPGLEAREAAQPAQLTQTQLRSVLRSELGGVEIRLASMEAGMKALASFQPTTVRLAMLEQMQAAQENAMRDVQRRAARDGQP